MQFSLDSRALKQFTRSLTCISKYGDELVIHSDPDALLLTSMSQAKTAFCSFTYERSFFVRYVAPQAVEGNDIGRLRCQLQTKAFLSVLRHRNTEKSVEKCEMTIIDGQSPSSPSLTGITPPTRSNPNNPTSPTDTFESRLIVRLHCKHGIVKTHKLILNTPSPSDGIPSTQRPTGSGVNQIAIQASVLKEIIDHFPNTRGVRNDPELVWWFGDEDVRIKSMEKGMDARGKSQLATELTIGADEFHIYDILTTPLTIAFFLKEFNAAVSLGDSLSSTMDIRLTDPMDPIYITLETDDCTILFIIATNPVRGEDSTRVRNPNPRRIVSQASSRATNPVASGVPAARKRPFEEGPEGEGSSVIESSLRGRRNEEVSQSRRTEPRSSFPTSFGISKRGRQSALEEADTYQDDPNGLLGADDNRFGVPPPSQSEPQPPSQSQSLFLSSQLSQVQIEAIKESGLGIENMDAEEFAAMLDDNEGEEITYSQFGRNQNLDGINHSTPKERQTELLSRSSKAYSGGGSNDEIDELADDEEAEYGDDYEVIDDSLGPTQMTLLSPENKTFRPLFED
ncbi:cell cycle checkpoint control rad9a [Pyrrhoderma noxium]|uniref:Cell cycle checkpoint control rad9a n=1 Tax=Pyrrhoderma noxium TaxID=2282107 RepID=A0A286UKW5_9AGAM|nr:cell cycle checkpoint control rad9a [Pyrrhoderma noxium]